MTNTTRLLSCLVLLIAVPLLGGCYVDAGPPPPGYYAPGHAAVYGRGYEWHSYGRADYRR